MVQKPTMNIISPDMTTRSRGSMMLLQSKAHSARSFLEGLPSRGVTKLGDDDFSREEYAVERDIEEILRWKDSAKGGFAASEGRHGSVSPPLSVQSPTGVMDSDDSPATSTRHHHWKKSPALSLFDKNKHCPPNSRLSRRQQLNQRSISVGRLQSTVLDEHIERTTLSPNGSSRLDNNKRTTMSELRDKRTSSTPALPRRNAMKKSTSHRGFVTTSDLSEDLASENPASHQRSSSFTNTTLTDKDSTSQMRRRVVRRNQHEQACSSVSTLLTSSRTRTVNIDNDSNENDSKVADNSKSETDNTKEAKKAIKKRTSSSSSSLSGKISSSSSTKSRRRTHKKVVTFDVRECSAAVVSSKDEPVSSGVKQRIARGRKPSGVIHKQPAPGNTNSKRVTGGNAGGGGGGVVKRMPPRSNRKGRLMEPPTRTKPAVCLTAILDRDGAKTNKVPVNQSSPDNPCHFAPLHHCPDHFDFIQVPAMREESGRSTRSGSISSLSMSSRDARSISSHRSRFRRAYSSPKLFLKASLIEEDDGSDNGNDFENYNGTSYELKELMPAQSIQDTELEIPNTASGRSNRTGSISELTAPTMASGHSALLYTNDKKADRTKRPTMNRWHSVANIIISSEEMQERQCASIIF